MRSLRTAAVTALAATLAAISAPLPTTAPATAAMPFAPVGQATVSQFALGPGTTFADDATALRAVESGGAVTVENAALHTIVVDGLDTRVAGIAARGLAPVRRETYPNGVRKVTYQDPDGNEFGLGGVPR